MLTPWGLYPYLTLESYWIVSDFVTKLLLFIPNFVANGLISPLPIYSDLMKNGGNEYSLVVGARSSGERRTPLFQLELRNCLA